MSECEQCHEPFKTESSTQKFCSAACATKHASKEAYNRYIGGKSKSPDPDSGSDYNGDSVVPF